MFLCSPPPRGSTAPYWGLLLVDVSISHSIRHTTHGSTPRDKWSARRRDLYLTTHSNHKRQTFEPAIPVSDRPQTYALARAGTGIGPAILLSLSTFKSLAFLPTLHSRCILLWLEGAEAAVVALNWFIPLVCNGQRCCWCGCCTALWARPFQSVSSHHNANLTWSVRFACVDMMTTFLWQLKPHAVLTFWRRNYFFNFSTLCI